jgi:threonine synthase
MNEIQCLNCHYPYPENGLPFRCPRCGGIFDFVSPLSIDPHIFSQANSFSGIWRFRDYFSLPENAPVITLGEGNTPLVMPNAYSGRLAFKLEFSNPTGSFKDRGTTLLVSMLKARGIESVVEDSSGNAGVSLAAYAVSANIHTKIFIPENTSVIKSSQMEVYNAEVVQVAGARSKASEAVMKATDQGVVYASHAYLPFGIPGFATIAFELLEQLGKEPGTIIVPVGQGSLLLGIGRGFKALKRAGMIKHIPKLVGVQARACAPLWAVFRYGSQGLQWVTEGETIAEGVRIKHPLRGDAILRLIDEVNGLFIVVDEEEIIPGRDQLAHLGLYVEPTSAIVWTAISKLLGNVPEPIIAILTGSGLKTTIH